MSDVPDEDGEYSSLSMLRDYECPDCGREPLEDLTEGDAQTIMGGDETGAIVCPQCGEELEPTIEAALAMLAMVQERMAQ